MKEDQFEKIVLEALSRARDVECSQEEFIEGLQLILGEVEVELQAAKETL